MESGRKNLNFCEQITVHLKNYESMCNYLHNYVSILENMLGFINRVKFCKQFYDRNLFN